MSVCIVGNITAPPKQNKIVPKETKKLLFRIQKSQKLMV